MSDLKSIIPFSEEEKALYCKYNFGYFLNKKMNSKKWNQEIINQITEAYENYKSVLLLEAKENKKQFYFFLEGQVRKMHSGGLLSTHFNLSEAIDSMSLNNKAYGENWAIFEIWAKYQKPKIRRKKIWKRTVEIGSIIGWVLGLYTLYTIVLK